MFLKEFAVSRYGPLPESGRKLLTSFNLFYGPNEEGKTLTIDALLKMLLGKAAGRSFEAVKRVEEKPEGYIILETGADREEIKLPEKGNIPELFAMSAAEFGNIFIIRDSDLSITGENNIYSGVTARLTGMRGDEIAKLKLQIQEQGGITATGDYTNQAPSKLKDRLKKAQLLLNIIAPLYTMLQEESFDRFEEELALCRESSELIKKKINRYRVAQSRDRYRKGLAALNELEKAREDYQKLDLLQNDDYEQMQRDYYKLEQLSIERRTMADEEQEEKIAIEGARVTLQSAGIALKHSEELEKKVTDTIDPLLTEYEKLQIIYLRHEARIANPFFSPALAILVLIILLSSIGLIVRPGWWFVFMLVGSAPLLSLLAWARYSLLDKKSRLRVTEAVVCSKAEEFGLPADTISIVRLNIARLKNELNQKREGYKAADREMEWCKRTLTATTERLERNRHGIEKLEQRIAVAKQNLGIKSLEHFSGQLKRKEELRVEVEKQKSLLESHFGKPEDHLPEHEKISFWKAKVAELSDYASFEEDLVYDHLAVKKLNAELELIENTLEELQEKMKEYLDRLREIGREANLILQHDENNYLPCQTILDLRMIRHKLDSWLSTREKYKEAALVALSLLADLEMAEEEKISALFGEESAVSSYFKLITGGHYRQVLFVGSDRPIRVVRHDGMELEAGKLSGGAYDQLYFSIRLVLGEKYLRGEKGFFILDDPFIKADPNRLETLLNMLFDLVATGWQVLYFSAKGEVRDALSKKVAAGEVKQFTIDTKH